MTRKLAATGIAIIVSIPLIPIVERGIGHLTGTDSPMVFPGQGWSLQKQKAQEPVSSKQIAIDLTESVMPQDAIAVISKGGLPRGDVIWLWVRPLSDAGYALDGPQLHSAYETGDLAFVGYTDDDSALNHAFPSGLFGGLDLIWDRVSPVWAGLDSPVGRIAESSFERRPAYRWSTLRIPENLNLFVGGANQATSYVPTLTSLAPAGAVAGGASLTLAVNGTGFAHDATLNWSVSTGSTSYALVLGTGAYGGAAAGSSAADVNSLAHYLAQTASVPTLSPNPEVWMLAAHAYRQAQREWPRKVAQVNASRISEFAPNNAAFAEALKHAAEAQETAQASAAPQPQRIDQGGWYALDVGDTGTDRAGPVELEFVPDKGEPRAFTLSNSGGSGEQAAWIHFREPGAVLVRARGAGRPALRGMDYAEFISRSRDITLSKAVLTVFLLEEIVPLTVWIFMVWCIRSFAYKRIMALPRMARKHARHEVDLMLNFAKWSGVACYLLWTAKDILGGVGVVLVG